MRNPDFKSKTHYAYFHGQYFRTTMKEAVDYMLININRPTSFSTIEIKARYDDDDNMWYIGVPIDWSKYD